MEPAPQENRRGIILVQLQTIRDPSAVRRQTPSEESNLRPWNTETEAPESTKNSQSERISQRNRREKLYTTLVQAQVQYQGLTQRNRQVGRGFTCRTASFLTPNRVPYSSELYLHASCDTNTVLERWRTVGRSWSRRTLGCRRRTGSGSNSINLTIFELSS